MKVGFRTPSLKRSFKARTTGRLKRAVKRSVNPFYGKRGMGMIKNPKRALYNQVYRRTTVGVSDIARLSKGGARSASGVQRVPGQQSCAVHALLFLTTAGIGNLICAIVKSSERGSALAAESPTSPSVSYTLRQGQPVAADSVFAAWTSGDLASMRRELGAKTNLVDRHFLLMNLAQETYRLRSQQDTAGECAGVSEMHLQEFGQIAPALRSEFDGSLPHVPTFQNYATLLTELGDYDRAIWVCELAQYYGLDDGTKSGFAGRIERIKKKQDQARLTSASS